MKLERFVEAEACYRHVLALRPDFAEAHRTLGNALRGLSLPRQAEDSYLRALEICPHDVPVVTMRGPSRAHCQGAAAMCRMGLDDWVADDIAGFVRLAVERARDVEGLAALRRGMRARWRNSPWRDAAVIARGLETALRMMWRRWCAGLPAAHFEVPPTPGRQAGFDA